VIDHVTIRVADLERARGFYSLVFELLDGPEATEGEGFGEWGDFSIAPATAERPLTRRLHAAFTADGRAQVDAWWRGMREAGHPDLGAPGPRPEYSPGYYGAFVADPAGNSIEAVHHETSGADSGTIDHLWLRVGDVDASTRFYAALAPVVDAELLTRPDRTTVRRGGPPSFTLVPGEPTEDVHIAFGVPDTATVDAFHRAGLDAGYASLGAPGERPEYHPGYYGAFLADPDGNSIEAVFHDRSVESAALRSAPPGVSSALPLRAAARAAPGGRRGSTR
jgi:catechol 2,3-dioxygenase-like lactoylglutathione lyase family enzyme